MKLVGVIDGDPFNPHLWSGSSRYLFEALQRRDALRAAIPAEAGAVERALYKVLSVQPDLARWRFKYHLSLGHYRAMTRQAKRALGCIPANDYDAILQVGAWYDLTRGGKPVVSYHDGNLAVLLKSPYGHPSIGARHIDATLKYERELYGRIDLVFPMSRWLADSFVEDNGVSRRKVFPVGAGVNLPHIRGTKGKDYSVPRILFVGLDFERKGGAYLLDAFRIVRAEIPDAELTIIGHRLEEVPPGVRSVGPLSKTNPADLERLLDEYTRASLFVMPSLYEPFGIVFAEAMAHRCPCIGTNICAMPEIIEHGRTGFLVPPRDSAALARQMIALLKEPAMAREFGERGHQKYRTDLTWDAVTGKICDTITRELG
ncbi:MAG TPA: glycosyltransferase family 4 protein [Vicinamibacterales bacterium]